MIASIQHLNISIAGTAVVQGVNLTVGEGERVGLIGPSGSGKSMISKAMLGLLPFGSHATATGSIRLAGIEILTATDARRAQLRGSLVGTVFQNPASSLNPVMKVGDQIELPLRLHYDLNRTERRERVDTMLGKVGLDTALANAYPSQLSGGQQQRVAIATALITAPRLIIADEPTTALDSLTQRQVVDLLTSLVDEAHASMLFITHDFAVLRRATTRCYVIDEGRVVESGPTERLLEHPVSQQAERLVRAADELTLHTTQIKSR